MRSTSPRSQPARTRCAAHAAAHAAALVVQRANRPLWHGRRRTERVAMPMIHGSAVRATLGRNGAGHASQSGRQDERAVLSVCRVQVRCISVGKKVSTRQSRTKIIILTSFLFCKSSLLQPFLFLIQVSLYGFPRLFTVTSEHIRLFTF